MKITAEINNRARSPVSVRFLLKIIRQTIEESGIEPLKEKNIEISVALVVPQEIRKLNRIYRKKDYSTDVLSFWEHKKLDKVEDKKIFLGEIVLCYNYIARCFGKKTEEELARAVSHGVLHLIGMGHGRKMFSVEKKIINFLKMRKKNNAKTA